MLEITFWYDMCTCCFGCKSKIEFKFLKSQPIFKLGSELGSARHVHCESWGSLVVRLVEHMLSMSVFWVTKQLFKHTMDVFVLQKVPKCGVSTHSPSECQERGLLLKMTARNCFRVPHLRCDHDTLCVFKCIFPNWTNNFGKPITCASCSLLPKPGPRMACRTCFCGVCDIQMSCCCNLINSRVHVFCFSPFYPSQCTKSTCSTNNVKETNNWAHNPSEGLVYLMYKNFFWCCTKHIIRMIRVKLSAELLNGHFCRLPMLPSMCHLLHTICMLSILHLTSKELALLCSAASACFGLSIPFSLTLSGFLRQIAKQSDWAISLLLLTEMF